MKKILLIFVLIWLILLSGCSREIHVHCDCAEAIADMQLSDIQTDSHDTGTTDSQPTTVESDIPIDVLEIKIIEVLTDMYVGDWTFVDIVRGEVDSKKYFSGVVLEPYLPHGTNEKLYSIIAKDPYQDIYAVVKIVHDIYYNEARIVERFYGNAGGITLHGEYLESFLQGYPMYEDRVIPTDCFGLIDYLGKNDEPHI